VERGSRSTVTILGIPVDRLTMTEAVARIDGFIQSREPHWIATADASMLVDAGDDPAFRERLLTADLVTPDSSGILWAAGKLGVKLEERVSGVDLVDRLCALSADKGYRVYLLGAAPGIAEMAAERLRLKHPGCNIVGTRNGFFPASDDDLVAHEVAAFDPDILFVAMGIPRQETFIVTTQSVIKARVAIGVGGSLDVHSGQAKRAPVLFQRLKIEWFWRLLQNPKKWRKTMKLPTFMLRVLRSRP